jgi:Tripartite tricarboxylate transporter TctB family
MPPDQKDAAMAPTSASTPEQVVGARLTVSPRAAGWAAGLLGIAIGGGVLTVLPAQTGTADHLAALNAGGPGFFPLMAAFVTVLASLWSLANVLWPRRGVSQDVAETLPWRPFLRIAGWLGVVIVGMYTFGMLVALGIATGGLAGAFGERRPARLFVISTTVPAAIYFVFEFALKILFPRGGWF